jgi:hypothetical protein
MNIGSERRIVVGSTGRLITHKPRVQVGPVTKRAAKSPGAGITTPKFAAVSRRGPHQLRAP